MEPIGKLRIGSMRHRVDVLAPTQNPTGLAGETEVEYPQVASRWCSITNLSVAEGEWGDEQTASASHMIRMRYFTGLTPQHRLRFQGREFNIVGPVNVDENGWEHRVYVKELVGETDAD